MAHRDLGILPDDEHWDLETEVVVVGGGGAGLAAAIAAAQGGAQTILLEKMRRPASNTARSGGMIPAAGTRLQRGAGIAEMPEDFAQDILNKSRDEQDRERVLHLAQTSGALVDWLTGDCNIQLEFVRDFKYPGHSQCRMHAPPSRTGQELAQGLRRALEREANADLVEGAPCVGLVADARGRVCGAVLDQVGAALRVRASKVVLGCNGFGGNRELVAKYCPEIADAHYFGGEGSTGEGILWGLALGAGVANMDGYQCHSTVAVPGETLITYAVVTEGGIQLNRYGQRFADETRGYSEQALDVLRQPALGDGDDGCGVARAWVLYDDRIHRIAWAFDDYRAAFEVGLIKRAETVSAMARLAGIDVAGAERTFADYQACARGEGRDRFGRSDCRILKGPLYGVRVTAALFHTQGGLTVDGNARVLRPDGSTIPNLYAAGGCAAGISGHGAGGYLSGNGLLTALGYGMLAGKHAAASVREERAR